MCIRICSRIKGDREFVLAAVQKWEGIICSSRVKRRSRDCFSRRATNGCAFQYAADELTADREFVLAAVQQNGYALVAAADKGDRELF